jgi:hypothetical protein
LIPVSVIWGSCSTQTARPHAASEVLLGPRPEDSGERGSDPSGEVVEFVELSLCPAMSLLPLTCCDRGGARAPFGWEFARADVVRMQRSHAPGQAVHVIAVGLCDRCRGRGCP